MTYIETLLFFLNVISLNFKLTIDYFILLIDNTTSIISLKQDILLNTNTEAQSLLDLPWPASEKMNSLVMLYLEVSYTVLFIFIIICIILFETVFIHSSRNKHFDDTEEIFSSYPVYFTSEEEHLIDMFVIILPTIIIIQIIMPTLGYLYNEEFLYYDSHTSLDINIIGNQWYWTYEYIVDICSNDSIYEWNSLCSKTEKNYLTIIFDSVIQLENKDNRLLAVDNSMVIPVNTNILLSFTSRDVIHSWALPQMGIKVDCIPGRITHTLFSSFSTGVFYGQCSELCGPLHGFMPICVSVVSFDQFFIWLITQYKILLSEEDIHSEFIFMKEVLLILNLDINQLNSISDEKTSINEEIVNEKKNVL